MTFNPATPSFYIWVKESAINQTLASWLKSIKIVAEVKVKIIIINKQIVTKNLYIADGVLGNREDRDNTYSPCPQSFQWG